MLHCPMSSFQTKSFKLTFYFLILAQHFYSHSRMIQFEKIKLRPALNAELPGDYLVSWPISNSIFPRLFSGKFITFQMIKVIKRS